MRCAERRCPVRTTSTTRPISAGSSSKSGRARSKSIKKAIEIVPSVLRMLVITTVHENTYLGKRANGGCRGDRAAGKPPLRWKRERLTEKPFRCRQGRRPGLHRRDGQIYRRNGQRGVISKVAKSKLQISNKHHMYLNKAFIIGN